MGDLRFVIRSTVAAAVTTSQSLGARADVAWRYVWNPAGRVEVGTYVLGSYRHQQSETSAVLTDADGAFRLEMPQIVPAFGQPHGHLAYDPEYDGQGFETVFLRPVMPSSRDSSLSAHFVLRPA